MLFARGIDIEGIQIKKEKKLFSGQGNITMI